MSASNMVGHGRRPRCMRDSGVDWLGQVPEGWTLLRNKNCFLCGKGIVGKDSTSTQLLSLTTRGVREKGRDEIGGKVPESFDTYQVVAKNDIVMCLFDMDCSAVFSGISPYAGMISPAYKVLKCSGRISPGYADYWFRYIGYYRLFKRYAKNIRYSLTYEDFATLPIALPPIPEQRAIAAYLDERCAKIDAMVADAKKLIEEYKAWKSSLIFEAVTGKREVKSDELRVKSELRDSGIEWIGQVPEGWKVSRVKYVALIENGQDPQTEGDIPVYGSGAGSFRTCGEFKDGPTVLLGRKGATLHIPHYITGRYWNVDTAFDVHMVGHRSLKWFYYLASVFDYKSYISQTTLPGMTQTNYNNMYIPLPLVDEQCAIAAYLDRKCAAIDRVVAEKEGLIADLEQYKKSLIFECVTGKREVA